MYNLNRPDPGRYSSEIATMREMGWSWQQLLEAPSDLVAEIEWKRHSTNHWQRKKQEREDAKRKNTHS